MTKLPIAVVGAGLIVRFQQVILYGQTAQRLNQVLFGLRIGQV